MRTRAITVALLLVGLCALLLWRGCSGPPVVDVRNDSGALVRHVTLAGRGFSRALPDIPPGQTVATVLKFRGESSLTLGFEMNGQPVTKADVAYLESGGGYRASLTIRPDGTVECRTRLGFSWRRVA